MRDRARRFVRCHSCRRRNRRESFHLFSVACTRHFDFTAQPRAIVNCDARRDETALHAARSAELHVRRRFQIAGHDALNHDFTRFDISLHFSIGSDGYLRLREVELSLGLAVDIEVVVARNFALDADSGRYAGNAARSRLICN